MLNIFLFNLPLTDSLGYEFSLINSILLSFLISLKTISILKKNFNSFIDHKTIFFKIFISFLLFVLIPLVLAVLKNIFMSGCPLQSGFIYYFIITIPSLFVGIGFGFLAFAITLRFAFYLIIFFYLIAFLIPLAEFYFNPQLFFYNPVFGYLNTTIYDEAISVELKLIIYRLLNIILFLFVSLLCYAYIFFKRLNKVRYGFNLSTIGYYFSWFILIVTVFLFYIYSSEFGFRSTKKNITSELGGYVSTEHFDIYYAQSLNKNKIQLSALYHEYYYRKLIDYFNVKPKQKISSYLFEDREQKKKLMGSANADVAKPWLYQIYLNADNYNSSLKHEIAHIFTAEFGWSIFKVAYLFNPSLIEGAATAADLFYDDIPVSKMAALAYQNNFKIDISSQFRGLNFFGQHSSLSYIYAGAFSEFLIKKFGIENFKEFYQTLDYQISYRVSSEHLYEEFYSYLISLDTGLSENKALFYFGRKSIFQRECPRYFAIKQNDAWDKFNNGNYSGALKLFLQLYKEGSTYSSFIGVVNSYDKLEDYQSALDFIYSEKSKFDLTAYIYNINLLTGDILVRFEKFEEAKKYYEILLNDNPNYNFYHLVKLRIALTNQSQNLYGYITGSSYDKYSILKKINKEKFLEESIPVMINLSKELKENYEFFLSLMEEKIDLSIFNSAYSAMKLAEYACDNLDFKNAIKFGELALELNIDIFYNDYIIESLSKYNWMSENIDLLNNLD